MTEDYDYGLEGPCQDCGLPFLECDCPFDDDEEWIEMSSKPEAGDA